MYNVEFKGLHLMVQINVVLSYSLEENQMQLISYSGDLTLVSFCQ